MPHHATCSAHIALLSADPTLITSLGKWFARSPQPLMLTVYDGSTTVELFAERPDGVLIDRATILETPRRIRQMRHRWPTCPVLVLNAADERECASWLDEGADDACIRGSALIVPRINALVRRLGTENADCRLAFGELVFDRERRRLWSAGIELHLSRIEYDILLCLFLHAPNSVSKEQVLAYVWPLGAPPQTNTIEVYTGYLRRKLRTSKSTNIRTVRGQGYALESIPSSREPHASTTKRLTHTARATHGGN